MDLVIYSSTSIVFFGNKVSDHLFLVINYILCKLMLHYKTFITLLQAICSAAANNQLLKGLLVMLQYITLFSYDWEASLISSGTAPNC